MQNFYAQGDLLIEQVEDIAVPREGTQLPSCGGIHVLATGERTGHRHAFYTDVIVFRDGLLGMYELPNEMYLCHVKIESESAELKHEEHDSIVLPRGTYRVRRQREYDENKREDRIVAD